MLNNIKLTDDGAKTIDISIDNHTESLKIKEIEKYETIIGLNKNINAVLYERIDIDATLYYYPLQKETITNESDSIIEDGEDKGYVTHTEYKDNRIEAYTQGNVLISITDIDETQKYYESTIFINNQSIKQSINQSLTAGEYLLTIKFLGNQFYKEYTYQAIINVQKRIVQCNFDKLTYYVDSGRVFTLEGTLTDKISGNKIRNCKIDYSFNEETNQVISDRDGEFSLNVIIPNPNKSHCTKNDVKYSLNFFINDSASYKLESTSITLVVNKVETGITVKKTEVIDNKINIAGYVTSRNSMSYASYGEIEIDFPYNNYKTTVEIEEDGSFEEEINIENIENATKNETYLNEYNAVSKNITTHIEAEDNKKIKKGDYINIDASVIGNGGKYITEGVIVFRLLKNNEEIKRYNDKVDNTGTVSFYFLPSLLSDYTLEIDYYGDILGYNNSSKTISIEVEE